MILDYESQYIVSNERFGEFDERFVKAELDRIEKDALYTAVKQANGWVCVKPERKILKSFDGRHTTFFIKVFCHAVESEHVRVYVPIYERSQMPTDVYKCTWCNGHTKNDMRGHCSACGAPRDNKYLESMNANSI